MGCIPSLKQSACRDRKVCIEYASPGGVPGGLRLWHAAAAGRERGGGRNPPPPAPPLPPLTVTCHCQDRNSSTELEFEVRVTQLNSTARLDWPCLALADHILQQAQSTESENSSAAAQAEQSSQHGGVRRLNKVANMAECGPDPVNAGSSSDDFGGADPLLTHRLTKLVEFCQLCL